MSRPHNGKLKAAVIGFTAALLLSLGLSLTVLRALLPLTALWPAALFCFAFTLAVYALLAVPLKHKWLIPVAAVLGIVIWGGLGGGPLHSVFQAVKAAALAFQGVPDAAAPYADTIRWGICLIFSLLAAALVWDDFLPLALFVVMAAVGLSFLLSQSDGLLLCALPAAAGLLLMLVQQDSRRYSVLPVAAILAALAFLLMPAHTRTVSPLDQVAARVRELVEDYLIPPETRNSFFLAAEGYQPLQDRLGGKAAPQNYNVMDVTSDRTVLLRARTYDQYTGANWNDTLSSRRYLYASPRFASLRDELLDLARPLCGDTVDPVTLHIHMLSPSPSTLFVPAHTRTVQLEGERMVLYYNLASEMFLTRDLAAGDTYTLTYSPYAPGDAATEAAIAACAEMEDPYYAKAEETYLALPRYIQQEIYDLAEAVTAGLETPYEKALAIRDYLRDNYSYSLDVTTPPEDADFVAWFLLREKEGYCTYFASAMTVLCRIAGVPARYVTGYLAEEDESGVITVTGDDAHAWTEVYLNGFGWLSFDATPSSGGPGSSGDSQPPATTPPPTPTPSPSPSPSPIPSPSPEPSKNPEESPAPTSSTEEQEDGREPPTPTPAPDPADSPTPAPTAQPHESGAPKGASPRLWILLAILLIIALLILRYLLTEPLRRARRKPDEAVETLYSAICGLLSMRGIQRGHQETLHDFAQRCEETALPFMAPLTHAYAAQIYGRHPADAKDYFAAYRSLRDAATPWARFRLTMKRMFTRSSLRKTGKNRRK